MFCSRIVCFYLSNTDIDECVEGLANGMRVCVGEGMRCNNTLGWYNCTCEDGFKLAEDGSCVDIDECILPRNPCRSGQQCRNIIGSYQCVRQVPCGFGYVLNPKTQQCEDVNECKADPYICGPGMICINVRGGHKCVDRQCPGKSRRDKFGNCVPCPVGFVYNTSTGTCDDVNECVDGSQCKPWERCVNKLGYFVCEQKINCEHGTRISANGTHCEDIDDCMEKLFNCDKNEICANTDGSYMCIPSPCTPTQVFNYETKMCVCEDGWKDDNGTCVDINECVENPQICPDDRTCVNHDGGYRCVKFDECPPGFHRHVPFGPCVDIDECKQGTAVCGENMYCFNTAGSYQCLCQRGYKNLNSTTCVDVDECLLFGSDSACPDPRARCVNTNGSHLCACPDGFTWADYPTSKCVESVCGGAAEHNVNYRSEKLFLFDPLTWR
ncbi:unnamed protein product [Dicrocoelium dendriticum]|nr:unnamed protein product [Dicrocoelium dendriticum]